MDKTDYHGELGEEVPLICFPPLLSFPLWELGVGDVSTYSQFPRHKTAWGLWGADSEGKGSLRMCTGFITRRSPL